MRTEERRNSRRVKLMKTSEDAGKIQQKRSADGEIGARTQEEEEERRTAAAEARVVRTEQQ